MKTSSDVVTRISPTSDSLKRHRPLMARVVWVYQVIGGVMWVYQVKVCEDIVRIGPQCWSKRSNVSGKRRDRISSPNNSRLDDELVGVRACVS